MDPQYNSVDTNSLESAGKGKKKVSRKIKHSSVTYPQKRVMGNEKNGPNPTTSPKRKTKKLTRKYTKVQK